ncbi:MAG: hypothetical protein CMJ42_05255 [Phyllobacteriaceae bacterium]|nr:hypothetical protein [Phyllobacteriaceae bacterium]MBA92733.1 hypothetical protein [Phyllobacteriaceae bacterium]
MLDDRPKWGRKRTVGFQLLRIAKQPIGIEMPMTEGDPTQTLMRRIEKRGSGRNLMKQTTMKVSQKRAFEWQG